MQKKLKWKSDLDKSVIIDNFIERDWEETLDRKLIFIFNSNL